MLRKLLIAVGISLLFTIFLVAAIFFTLPTDSIRHLLEKNIEKALKYEQGIEIADISISPLLNITAKNFQMTPRVHEEISENLATAGGDFDGFYCPPYVEEQTVTIDEVFVNPSIFKIARKKPEGKFNLKIQNGTISGEIRSVDKSLELITNGESIQLETFTLLSNFTKAKIYGELSFDMRAVLDAENQKKNANQLQELRAHLTSSATAMCPKRIKLNISSMPFIEMPFTVFGDIEAVIELQKDKLIIEELTSTGPDIKLDVKGDVMLKSDKNPNPRLNITATILPSQSWIDNNNMNAIYKICEKHDDGSIELKLNGSSKRLKHDCGTPIPEPESEVPPADNSDNKADNSDNKDKPEKQSDKPEKTPEEKAIPEPTPKQAAENANVGEKKNRPRELNKNLGRDMLPMDSRTERSIHSDRKMRGMSEREHTRPARLTPQHARPELNELDNKLNETMMRDRKRRPRDRERLNADERTLMRE